MLSTCIPLHELRLHQLPSNNLCCEKEVVGAVAGMRQHALLSQGCCLSDTAAADDGGTRRGCTCLCTLAATMRCCCGLGWRERFMECQTADEVAMTLGQSRQMSDQLRCHDVPCQGTSCHCRFAFRQHSASQAWLTNWAVIGCRCVPGTWSTRPTLPA